jgi:CheY-like chemotaxis protein
MSPFRVLIVDDDVVINLASCEILRDSGFDAIGVYCAAAAFEAVTSGPELSALVTDIDLGTGADGFEVARRARVANRHLPVVYISGAEEARFRSEGVARSEFLRKPVQPPEIVEALRRAIRRNTRLEAGNPTDEPHRKPASARAHAFSAAASSVWW